jgi:exopolyphosphatase/guanosine-5'-triphosphate,3'-diphosphate pyrophosphatase
LADTSESLRLGADIDRDGEISPRKLEELVETLLGYEQYAHETGVSRLRLLATQAIRVAANKDHVCEVIEEATGLQVEVLSPSQEAYLAFLGADASCPSIGPQVMLDIGGGSAQIAIGQYGQVWDSISLPLGAARMSSHFLPNDPPSHVQEALLAGYLAKVVLPALPLPDTCATGILGVGGTLRRISPILSIETGELFPHDAVDSLILMLRGKSANAIAEEYNVKPDRARLFLPAALLLREVWRGYDCPPIIMAEYGLREGAILALARAGENHAMNEV